VRSRRAIGAVGAGLAALLLGLGARDQLLRSAALDDLADREVALEEGRLRSALEGLDALSFGVRGAPDRVARLRSATAERARALQPFVIAVANDLIQDRPPGRLAERVQALPSRLRGDHGVLHLERFAARLRAGDWAAAEAAAEAVAAEWPAEGESHPRLGDDGYRADDLVGASDISGVLGQLIEAWRVYLPARPALREELRLLRDVQATGRYARVEEIPRPGTSNRLLGTPMRASSWLAELNRLREEVSAERYAVSKELYRRAVALRRAVRRGDLEAGVAACAEHDGQPGGVVLHDFACALRDGDLEAAATRLKDMEPMTVALRFRTDPPGGVDDLARDVAGWPDPVRDAHVLQPMRAALAAVRRRRGH